MRRVVGTLIGLLAFPALIAIVLVALNTCSPGKATVSGPACETVSHRLRLTKPDGAASAAAEVEVVATNVSGQTCLMDGGYPAVKVLGSNAAVRLEQSGRGEAFALEDGAEVLTGLASRTRCPRRAPTPVAIGLTLSQTIRVHVAACMDRQTVLLVRPWR
jgi:hypothetical protein